MRISQLSTTSFQSKLPPKQQNDIEPPKHWKVWGKDYWNDFALDCKKEGLSKEFFEYLERLDKNGDDGILALDEYVSDWGVHNYVFGLYDNVKDLELDRQLLDRSGDIVISKTRDAKKHIDVRSYDMYASMNANDSEEPDEEIDLKGATSITAALLYILKKITTPGSKEYKHLGFEFEPRILRELNKFRIK